MYYSPRRKEKIRKKNIRTAKNVPNLKWKHKFTDSRNIKFEAG